MIDLNKIYNEDCLEGMKRIPDKSIDMILCDMPYGITDCKWDTIIPFEPLWEQYERVIKDNGAIVLTASQPFTTDLVSSNRKLFRYEMIWNKTYGKEPFATGKRPMKAHENICVFYKTLPTFNPQKTKGLPYKDNRKGQKIQSDHYIKDRVGIVNTGTREPISVIDFKNPNKRGQHPTQKPVALFEYLIKTYTNEGETVLDNCIGSGTTAIACINTNRNYIGFELDKQYCEIANERIRFLQQQQRLC